jgi:hypothetical protein
MEIPVVAQLQIEEEGNDSLEYYYDIVVIKLSAESDGDAADCSHHRLMQRRAPWVTGE